MPLKLDAANLEKAMRDLRAECDTDEVADFTPEQIADLTARMRAEMKDGPLLQTGRKPRKSRRISRSL